MLDNAREVVARALGVRFEEVTFTPSGTHAVHLGVLGLLAGRARVSDLFVHAAVEHSSVVHAAQWHARNGGRVAEIPVSQVGRTRLELPEGPIGALALQSANHEVATLQPVTELAELAGDVPLFMDACASAGRLPLPAGWAAAAASAHKWGGPAGVGVLLVRKGSRWRAPFPGDDRADERATGFENVPAALAAAAALQALAGEAAEVATRQHALIDRIRATVAEIPDVEVVGDPAQRLPHLVTFSCLFVDGEALVTELDRRGFEVSSGSACTASTLTPSHVLAAMGVLTHGNVRLSLTRTTTADDVEAFLAVLPDVVASLRAQAGL